MRKEGGGEKERGRGRDIEEEEREEEEEEERVSDGKKRERKSLDRIWDITIFPLAASNIKN